MSKEKVDLVLMEKLFNRYKNQYINERMTDKQNENLQYWHARADKYGITISQIDNWMYETKIIPKIITIFDTGIVFAKLKIFAVDFSQFLSFIDQLSREKNLDANEIKLKMLEPKSDSEEL